jgi:hypothetical protein
MAEIDISCGRPMSTGMGVEKGCRDSQGMGQVFAAGNSVNGTRSE